MCETGTGPAYSGVIRERGEETEEQGSQGSLLNTLIESVTGVIQISWHPRRGGEEGGSLGWEGFPAHSSPG